jgi:hypothetical protein
MLKRLANLPPPEALPTIVFRTVAASRLRAGNKKPR